MTCSARIVNYDGSELTVIPMSPINQELIRKQVEDIEIRLIDGRSIRYRYFDCEGWDCVLVQLFGDEPDFLGKEESYRRRMRRIHFNAINDLADLYETVS